jgi:membrane protease YdiL (CAAX protease family)
MEARIEQARQNGILGKIIHYPLVRIILGCFGLIAGVSAMQSIVTQPLRAMASLDKLQALPWLLLYMLGSMLAAFECYLAYVHIVERRRATELTPVGAGRKVSAGLLLGGALFTATLVILWPLGAFRATPQPNWLVLAVALAINIVGAVVEELLLRGILLRIAEEAVGTWLALASSVLVFGLLHAGDPTASIATIVFVALAGGLLTSAAYIMTRTLWLPIGIHAGWDLVQGIVFGTALAGHQLPGILRTHLDGSVLVTGGSMGPEGSVVALILCLAASGYMLLRAGRCGQLHGVPWRRERPDTLVQPRPMTEPPVLSEPSTR